MLGLDYKDTKIEEAGLAKYTDNAEKDGLVVEFWSTFNRRFKGAIPPGIIFLPGEKVEDHVGYGWAPRTWMSAHEVDYPDPLGRWNSITKLEKEGLGVSYPGFLLHIENESTRRKVLGTDISKEHFTFPVDRKLLEWYNAKPADSTTPSRFIESILRRKTSLAIILSRPHPGESPHEIGLLVGIYRGLEDKTAKREPFYCRIIQRMHVWRETRYEYLIGPSRALCTQAEPGWSDETKNKGSPHWKIISGSVDQSDVGCIGEILGPDQNWVVDGSDEKYRLKKDEDKKDEDDMVVSRSSDGDSNPKSKMNTSFITKVFNIGWRVKSQPNTHPEPQKDSEPVPGRLAARKTLPGYMTGESSASSYRLNRQTTLH